MSLGQNPRITGIRGSDVQLRRLNAVGQFDNVEGRPMGSRHDQVPSGRRDGAAGSPQADGKSVRPSRAPLDGRLVGWLHIGYGIYIAMLGLVLITGIGRPGMGEWRVLGPFGVVEFEWPWQSHGWAILSGVLLGLGGWGLVRWHRCGWWLLVVLHLERLPTLWVNTTARPALASTYLVFSLGALVWLVWRARVIRPFSRRCS